MCAAGELGCTRQRFAYRTRTEECSASENGECKLRRRALADALRVHPRLLETDLGRTHAAAGQLNQSGERPRLRHHEVVVRCDCGDAVGKLRELGERRHVAVQTSETLLDLGSSLQAAISGGTRSFDRFGESRV